MHLYPSKVHLVINHLFIVLSKPYNLPELYVNVTTKEVSFNMEYIGYLNPPVSILTM